MVRSEIPNHESLRAHTHRAMGTEFHLYLDLADESQTRSCFQAVFEEIDRIEATFSRFRPSSELSRINHFAAAGPVVTDPEVFQLLAAAQDISAKTDGVFDITVGRLTRAWGFPDHEPSVPAPDVLAEAQSAVGSAYLELDADWRTVHFLRPGLELDLGAFAKGYAVDRALAVLSAAGVAGLIDAGSSSIAATGAFFTQGWQVAVKHPTNPAEPLCELSLGTRALSTSGIAEQHFEQDGRTYSHLIDPTMSAPASTSPQVLQATVLAPTSALADALSTAIFLLGPQRGRTVLAHFADCSALWVCSAADGIVCHTHNWTNSTFSSSSFKEENNGNG